MGVDSEQSNVGYANGKEAGSGQGAREADKEAQLRRAPVGSWKQELPMTSCKATPARSTLRSDKDSQRSAWTAHRHEKRGKVARCGSRLEGKRASQGLRVGTESGVGAILGTKEA